MSKYPLFFIALAVLFVSGCASTGDPAAPEAGGNSIAAVADTQPSSPVSGELKTAPAAETTLAPDSPLAKLIDRIQRNPLTLFWRDTGTYSYYVGGVVKAEFSNNQDLTLSPGTETADVECRYRADGSVATDKPELKQACDQLMMTLEQELAE